MNKINRAVVIGAGTMGAAIAAHLANARVPVTLLDIVPRELNDAEKKQGLTLKDKVVRDRIAREGLERAQKSRPASFVSEAHQSLVSIGNLEDDLDVVAQADWVLEAIVENLEIKRDLMARLDELRGEHTIVSTNTSGIPVAQIAEGRSAGFRAHFLGSHFFNPPRYLKLLEIIPTPDTSGEVVERLSRFGERYLGKGIVLCKDTPNFIANRIGSVTGAFALGFALEHNYTVPEIDAISGPLIGRPKTAVFRLLDLVGIDVAEHVRSNLAKAIPEDEIAQQALASEKGNALTAALIENGWLGNKNKIGFYKDVRQDGEKQFWPLNLQTLEHEPPGDKPRFDSVGQAKDIEDFGAKIKTLLAGEDRASDYLRATTYFGLAYASHVIPEVADNPVAIDDAVRWGFQHDHGPFEVWDMLGVAETVEAMTAAGHPPAAWVNAMLKAGHSSFYEYEGPTKTAVYDPGQGGYLPLESPANQLSLAALRADKRIVKENAGATLYDLGDGIAGVEFHTKMNALDEDVLTMIADALDIAETQFDGVVIGNEGENFSAGANLFFVVMAAQSEQWDDLDFAISALQDLNMHIRYFPKPVVVAPAGLTLGGGCEITMHAGRVVAASETYIGLVETGAGVIPAGGGTKEMMRRLLNPPMRSEHAEALPYLERIFTQVGQSKVATSAEEARAMGILGPEDRVVMNRAHLLAAAKREARHLADSAYAPPLPEQIYAAGRDALAALRIGIYMFREGRYITDYDTVVGEAFARVLCGGDLSGPAWVSEQYILDLEREAFLSLCGEERSQQRIWHILQTGKPLRN
jgi:3-hydroxyacyl-CoA dehydrogenase